MTKKINDEKNGRRKLFVGLGIVVTLSLLAAFTYYFRSSGKSAVNYKTIPVSRGDLAVTILSTGTVNPENRLNIQAPIAGRAEQVLVDQGNSVKKGQTLIWISSTERAALLDSARSSGPEELKKWEDIYRPTPVLAPVDGMIIQRNIQPGQTFSTTDAILVMSDHLIVQAQVDETDLSQIHLKQPASIVMDAYPANPVLGKVKKIAYDAKTVNNVTTYEVDVLPDSVPKFMRSGMTANITFPVGTAQAVIFVPADAVKTKEGRPYVLIPAAGRGQPETRNVTLGISDGKRVEITSGLNEGEQILEPEFKLGGPKGAGSPFSPFGGRH